MIFTLDNMEIEMSGDIGYLSPDPNCLIPPHAHNNFELHIVTEGRGYNHVRQGKLDMFPDIVYVAPPGEIHEQRVDHQEPMALYFVHFKLHHNFGAHFLPRIYSRLPFANHELQSILDLKQSSTMSGRFLSQLRLMNLVCQILEPSIAEYCDQGKLHHGQAEPSAATQRDYVKQAVMYIENHLFERICIEEIAADCFISARHLSRLFLKTMGMPIQLYIQQQRFEWACRQLKLTNLPVEEISDHLSFCNTQYFCKWFKKIAAKTPSEFRNSQNPS